MKLQITTTGLLATIQDMGRYGYQHAGVPVSGSMDKLAASIANILLGNDPTAAVIELTYGGAVFLSKSPLLIACCGGGSTLEADGRPMPFWTPLFIPAGTTLKFASQNHLCRSYVAIAGGWDVPKVLGSHSTYLPFSLGGINGSRLLAGTTLQNNPLLSPLSQSILIRLHHPDSITYLKWHVNALNFANYHSRTIRFVAGHEFDWFDSASQTAFATSRYAVSNQSDRMGYHLIGPELQTRHERELLSTAVTMGTMQVTKSGSPILLMADCQTTGGYPRIGQVALADLPLCAQLKPGDAIRFKEVSLAHAEAVYLRQQAALRSLETVIRKRFLGKK